MKIFFVTIFLFSVIIVQAQSKAQREIKASFDASEKMWNDGDLDGYMDGYAKGDSTMFINKTIVSFGWQDSYDTFKKAFPTKESMGKLTSDIKMVKRLSKTCYLVVGSFHVERGKDSFGGNYSDIVQKIKGKWVVIVDHS